jgi:hypothetical protein
VDNSLLNVAKGVNPNTELFGVISKRFDLSSAGWVSNWLIDIDSWSVVILGSDSQVRSSDRSSSQPKTIKSLRAGYLM